LWPCNLLELCLLNTRAARIRGWSVNAHGPGAAGACGGDAFEGTNRRRVPGAGPVAREAAPRRRGTEVAPANRQWRCERVRYWLRRVIRRAPAWKTVSL